MKTEEFVKKYDIATKYPTEVWFFNKMAPKDMSAVKRNAKAKQYVKDLSMLDTKKEN